MSTLKERLFKIGMMAASAGSVIFLGQHFEIDNFLAQAALATGVNLFSGYGNAFLENVKDEWLHNREPKVNEVLERALLAAYRLALEDIAKDYRGATDKSASSAVNRICKLLSEVSSTGVFSGTDSLEKRDLFRLIGETPEDAVPKLRNLLAIADDFSYLNANTDCRKTSRPSSRSTCPGALLTTSRLS